MEDSADSFNLIHIQHWKTLRNLERLLETTNLFRMDLSIVIHIAQLMAMQGEDLLKHTCEEVPAFFGSCTHSLLSLPAQIAGKTESDFLQDVSFTSMSKKRRVEHVIWGASFFFLVISEASERKGTQGMKTAATAIPNELLSHEREQRHWTQEYVAEQIGAPDPKMVGKWERGIIIPTAHYRQKLTTFFGKSARELGLVRRGEVPFWNVPYRQNPFFTGREDILTHLNEALRLDRTAASTQPYALSGLGGVGKTQTAVEYAYRYRHKYHAVLWVRADAREVLTSDFAALASLLRLPKQNEQNLGRTLTAVKRWLIAMTRWLLIFDNVDDLRIINDFIPSPCRGHVLLTTRTSLTGTLAHAIEIDTMGVEEGAYFLLRRAKMVAPNTSQDNASELAYSQARVISQALGGLPLALDQAGAYIEETKCSLADYINLYQTRREMLLKWRGELALDHPEPVATTWSISFEKLRQGHPVAIELLKILAFLAPDAIPEELISAGAPDLGPFLQHVATEIGRA